MARSTRAKPAQPKKATKGKKSGNSGDSEQDSYTPEELDSDALDESAGEDSETLGTKRKRGGQSKTATKSPKKKRRRVAAEDDEEDDDDLKEGQEVVGVVVQAPKTGRVPAGQISKNTLDFLEKLKDSKYNDREWFKLHDPVYRQAETEWKDFVEILTDMFSDADPQIPPLPPKDLIHRIYRDIRFSNDKTPYKKSLSATFSRTGRKGVWAGYHVSIRPGGSIIAAGAWAPSKAQLDNIRANIIHSPDRLRQVLGNADFVELFPGSIFGAEDELKSAPKGISKDHKDIDLLRCRSFTVSHHFTDEEVLDEEWSTEIIRVVNILRPFVHCLNDMMGVPPDDEE